MSDPPAKPPQDETEAVALPVRSARRAAPQASRGGLGLVLLLVAVGGGVGTMALTGMKDNASYSKPVDELLAQRDKYLGRPVRAEGVLVKGSLNRRESPCEYLFSVEKSGQSMPVRFAQCVVPDNFQDTPGMDVALTVEGALKAAGTFEATNILTKFPSKYEEKSKAGEKNPHLVPTPVGVR